MRLTDLLLGLTLFAVAVVAGLALLPAGPAPSAHPAFATMLVSGGHPPADWIVLGAVFGILIAAILVTLLTLGLRRGRPGVGRAMFAAFVVYAATMGVLLALYAAVDPTGGWRIGPYFPTPTAWMLFVLWPLPFCFALLWIWKFREWVWGPGDDERLQKILTEDRARRMRQ